MIKKITCILTSIIVLTSVCSLPSFAASEKTYKLSDEEMNALMSTCIATYNIGGGGSSIKFVNSSATNPPLYLIEWSTNGGPNQNTSFNLDFTLDISCLSIKIEEFCSLVRYDGSTSSYSSVIPTYGYFYLNDSISSVSPTTINAELPYEGTTVNGNLRIHNYKFDTLTAINSISTQFKTSFGYPYKNIFLYGIQNIEFTGQAEVIDNLEEAIQAIIENDNKNTQEIIDNYNQKAQEIIDTLEKPSDEDTAKQEEMDNKFNEVQKEADDIKNSLDSVKEPDLDEIDFDSVLEENYDISTVKGFFDMIFGNTIIITMCLISITFVFASFIPFGKKT